MRIEDISISEFSSRSREAQGGRNRFSLEALEARVLLSGDAPVPVETPDGGSIASPVGESIAASLWSEDSILAQPLSADLNYEPEEAARSGISLFSNTSSGDPQPTKKLFEYKPASGALDAILKVDGADILLVSGQTELKRQPISETTEIKIFGTDQADKLTIDASKHFFVPVKFSAGAVPEGSEDVVHLKGTAELEGTFSPNTPTGVASAKIEIKHPASVSTNVFLTTNIQISGVNSVVAENLKLLTIKTPAIKDQLEVVSVGTDKTKIQGKSGGVNILPITFNGIENVILDAASAEANTSTGAAGVLSAISLYFKNKADQITIFGRVGAAGLKNFSIQTGGGSDSLYVIGNDLSLPVPGGVFGYVGGTDTDYVFARSTSGMATIDQTGNGVFQSGKGELSLTSVEQRRDAVERPLIFIPGLAGSFAVDSAIGKWFTDVGIPLDQLDADPIGNLYGDILTVFDNVGYQDGITMLVANWDWRLPIAPVDGTTDGVINEVTAQSLTDNTFHYAIDYLATAIKQAVENWGKYYPGEVPQSVDIVAHSAGGLIARAYIQSSAYGGQLGTGTLAKVNNLTMIGTPNRGYTEVWNPLHDNWGLSMNTRVFSMFMSLTYQRVVAGARVFSPLGDITLNNILDNAGNPSPLKFIALYLPSLRDLLPTFDFVDDGTGKLSDLNNDPLRRNNFLLDLNDGLDFRYETPAFPTNTNTGTDTNNSNTQFPAGSNPNKFVDHILGKLTIIYSSAVATPDRVVTKVGAGGKIVPFDQMLGRHTADGETWYQDKKTATADSGDGVTLKSSAIGQFLPDPRLGTKLFCKKSNHRTLGFICIVTG